MLDRLSTEAAGLPAKPLDLRYPGGKGLAGLAEWIVSLAPPHVFYAEPFAGKGGVFRHKAPALRTYLVDHDPDVIAWWERQSLPGVIAHTGDGIRWLELAAEWAPPDLLIYVDPPYLLTTRVKKRIYKRELTAQDHLRILRAVKRLRCPVTLSGYWSNLYFEELAVGFDCQKREVITRGGTLREECLWRNFACLRLQEESPALAMQYSALGADFRERERVGRKLKRWTAKFERMDSRERRAMLLALLDAERAAC